MESKFKLHLVWVGASTSARTDARRLGITNITWVDPLASPVEVSKWYNTFDIYCHVNKLGETFGNTVAEAMMHGKPVVSLAGKRSYPQAQFELLADTQQFAANYRSFRRKLSALASDEGFREILGETNRIRALAEFSPDSVARRYINLYQRTLEP
jgi:glycosyltransferase involved in cell wall biosynthesis